MKAYQQRAIDEKRELDKKVNRLNTFLGSEVFGSLPAPERDRMIRQSVHMEAYATVLGERIAAFEEEA